MEYSLPSIIQTNHSFELFFATDSLTIALQEYAIIKNDAKKNPVEKFQRDVQKKLNMWK